MVSWGRILSGTAIAITLGLGGLAAKPHLEDAWDDHKYELQSEAWAAERQARAEAEEQQYQTDVTRIQTDLDQILSHFHTEEGKNRAVQRLVSAGVLTDATNVEIAEDFLFDKGWYQMGVELLEKNGTDSSDFLARAITQLESKQKYNTA